MFRHIVFWNFKENANNRSKAENMTAVQERLVALTDKIPQIVSLEVGRDLLHTPASYDLSLLVTLQNQHDFEIYRDHPDHVAVAAFIGTVVDSRACIDYITD